MLVCDGEVLFLFLVGLGYDYVVGFFVIFCLGGIVVFILFYVFLKEVLYFVEKSLVSVIVFWESLRDFVIVI